MYNDRDFQGHFSTGSRAQTAVLPDDAWFPATLPLPFRERFLADTKSDNVVSFINQYSVDAERAAQTATSAMRVIVNTHNINSSGVEGRHPSAKIHHQQERRSKKKVLFSSTNSDAYSDF
jgi:hypothetical protein